MLFQRCNNIKNQCKKNQQRFNIDKTFTLQHLNCNVSTISSQYCIAICNITTLLQCCCKVLCCMGYVAPSYGDTCALRYWRALLAYFRLLSLRFRPLIVACVRIDIPRVYITLIVSQRTSILYIRVRSEQSPVILCLCVCCPRTFVLQ